MIPSLYFQEEKIRLGMIKVYSDRFCWKKSKNDEMLIVQMKMEDFSSASEPVIIMILIKIITIIIIIIIIIIIRKNYSDIFFFIKAYTIPIDPVDF